MCVCVCVCVTLYVTPKLFFPKNASGKTKLTARRNAITTLLNGRSERKPPPKEPGQTITGETCSTPLNFLQASRNHSLLSHPGPSSLPPFLGHSFQALSTVLVLLTTKARSKWTGMSGMSLQSTGGYAWNADIRVYARGIVVSGSMNCMRGKCYVVSGSAREGDGPGAHVLNL